MLLRILSERWALPQSHLFLASSTTHAHYCFAASALKPGDRVLYESPGYLPLLDALGHLQVRAIPYHRSFENGFALPRGELERKLGETGARLLLLTYLHNPSGVALSESEIDFLRTRIIFVLGNESEDGIRARSLQ